MFKLTCIGLQVLWRNHDDKSDCSFIAKHLIGPAADGAHALDCRDTIVGNKHLCTQYMSLEFNRYLLSNWTDIYVLVSK